VVAIDLALERASATICREVAAASDHIMPDCNVLVVQARGGAIHQRDLPGAMAKMGKLPKSV
jgi:hypothetical protein